MANLTNEVNKILSYASESLDDDSKTYLTTLKRNHQWIIDHQDWVAIHGMLHVNQLNMDDPLAAEFVELDVVQTHLQQLRSHLFHLNKLYTLLIELGCNCFKIISPNQLKYHDYSKGFVLEIVGYVEKWVLESKTRLFWRQSCDHHLNSNPHHLQHFWKDSGKEISASFLAEALLDGLSRKTEKRPLIILSEIFNFQDEKAWIETISMGPGRTGIEYNQLKDMFLTASSLVDASPKSGSYYDM